MPKAQLVIRRKGSTLIEALLAVTVFSLFVTAVVGGMIYGRESTSLAGQRQRATSLADECEEAVRGIRDGSYSNLVNGTYGLVLTGGHWTLSDIADTTDIFTRSVTIADGLANQKVITCNVSWQQNTQRNGSVQLVSYLTNWDTTVNLSRNGMLVYGAGGTTSDTINYQIYNDNSGTWSSIASAADVDGATTNKYLRRVQLYSSPTRNEKILISRHYNGAGQWIYAQVYNGSTGTWGNVNQLATWNATTYLDVKNFGGTYLANGDFLTVYSDNTTTPKFKVWNGTSWSTASGIAGTATPSTGGIPNYIVAKQRPGSNEAMVAVFDQSSDTNSLYFWIGANGTYETADFVLSTEHSAAAPLATKQLVDFDWSASDTTKGALVYTSATNDRQMDLKIWTANGNGSGSWGTAAQFTPAQGSNIGALSISSIKGTASFVACDKNAAATPGIICMRANTSGWITTSNTTIAAATDTGIQSSYDFNAGLVSPTYGINVFSDNTGILKYIKFNISNNTWDVSPTSINSTAVGIIKTVRTVPNPITNDIIVITADANRALFSAIYDGSNNNMFSTPPAKAWQTIAGNGTGSATTDYWYDFVWDGI